MRFLVSIVVYWLLNAVVLALVAWIFTDVHGGTTGQMLAAAAIFGILNTFLKPILRLLTFPLAIVTLGLAWFGVSMLMLWITSALVHGFQIDGFWTLVWATIVVGIVNFLVDILFALWPRHSSSSGVVPAV